MAGSLPWLRLLLPPGPTKVTGSSQLPGPSGNQLQVTDVFLDPLFVGVSTDLPSSLGEEDDTWFGALGAGFRIVNYKLLWNLSGGIDEAAELFLGTHYRR